MKTKATPTQIIAAAHEHINNLEAEKKRLRGGLSEIKAVACGEKQIDSDGLYDDSAGLHWIYKRVLALEK